MHVCLQLMENTAKKFQIPSRKFTQGPKKMISWRLSESMISEIEKVAADKGWNVTELVTTVLDQFLQEQEQPE